jgi:hypothetical protein
LFEQFGVTMFACNGGDDSFFFFKAGAWDKKKKRDRFSLLAKAGLRLRHGTKSSVILSPISTGRT